jgi:hypothetical protein
VCRSYADTSSQDTSSSALNSLCRFVCTTCRCAVSIGMKQGYIMKTNCFPGWNNTYRGFQWEHSYCVCFLAVGMCVHMGRHALWIYAGAMMCPLVFVWTAVTHCPSTMLVPRQVGKRQDVTRNWVIGFPISVAKSVFLRYMGYTKCAGIPQTLCVCLVNEASVPAVFRWWNL